MPVPLQPVAPLQHHLRPTPHPGHASEGSVGGRDAVRGEGPLPGEQDRGERGAELGGYLGVGGEGVQEEEQTQHRVDAGRGHTEELGEQSAGFQQRAEDGGEDLVEEPELSRPDRERDHPGHPLVPLILREGDGGVELQRLKGQLETEEGHQLVPTHGQHQGGDHREVQEGQPPPAPLGGQGGQQAIVQESEGNGEREDPEEVVVPGQVYPEHEQALEEEGHQSQEAGRRQEEERGRDLREESEHHGESQNPLRQLMQRPSQRRGDALRLEVSLEGREPPPRGTPGAQLHDARAEDESEGQPADHPQLQAVPGPGGGGKQEERLEWREKDRQEARLQEQGVPLEPEEDPAPLVQGQVQQVERQVNGRGTRHTRDQSEEAERRSRQS